MTIRVTCDTCGKVLKAKEEHAGKKAKCPDCGSIVAVPRQEILDAEADDPFDFGAASSDDDYAAADAQRSCPACGEEIKKDARKCRFCGEILDPNLKRSSSSNRRSSSRGGAAAGNTADLGKRFVGALADAFVPLLFLVPAFGLVAAGGGERGLDQGSPLAVAGVLAGVLGFLVFLGLQLYLLATRSQTIGKYLVKTQIYDLETDAPAGFLKCFVLRALVNSFIGMLPCVGGIYSLVDILFIFGEEHRCLHDQIAGTYVVDIS